MNKNNKKIFVTGGCGFIGSNFIKYQIQKCNNQILNYDKLTYAGNINNLIEYNTNPSYNFVKGDLINSDKINHAISNFEPDYIINFAAESHVDRSIDGPKEFINTNILGVYELLEASLKYYNQLLRTKKDTFKFMHISTDEVYGSLGDDGSFTELSPYNPSSPYSASKASSDHLVKAWNNTFKLPTIITNCSNNYGPHQFPEKLIPHMILNCLNNKELPVYGDGKNIRDWIYVQDHCDALNKVMMAGNIGETYNIGGNEEKSNLEIVEKICDILNTEMPSKDGKDYKDLIIFVKDRPGHDFRYAINCSKIKNNLGWSPLHTFEEAILKTIKWYLANRSWWKEILDNSYQLNRIGEK